MRFNCQFIIALICLNLAGCAGCGVVPIAKPWNSNSAALKEEPCANSSAKKMHEDQCSSVDQNPDF